MAKQQRDILVLVRYSIKQDCPEKGLHRGDVVLHIRNDKGKEYFTTLRRNKAHSCSCIAGMHGRNCYHIADLAKAENAKATARKFAAKSLPKWAINLIDAGVIEIPGKVKVEAPKLVNPFKKPSTFILDRIEAAEHKASVLSEMREIRQRRDVLDAPLTTARGFSILKIS